MSRASINLEILRPQYPPFPVRDDETKQVHSVPKRPQDGYDDTYNYPSELSLVFFTCFPLETLTSKNAPTPSYPTHPPHPPMHTQCRTHPAAPHGKNGVGGLGAALLNISAAPCALPGASGV